MHLSEAIRLGAMMGPQCFDEMFGDSNATCAMGAAIIAVGVKKAATKATSVRGFWPWLESERLRCPACTENGNILPGSIVFHLNDDHLWTRERIADWVEEQEYRLGIRTKEESMDIIAQETSIDKSQWEDGEWQQEPDKIHWIDQETDMDCLIVRNGSGALCGYVAVTSGHPLFKKGYNEVYNWENGEGVDIDVHGGLTFSDVCHEGGRICHVPVAGRPHDVWWFGFDCAHSGDLCPGRERSFSWHEEETYRNVTYVQRECASLARQLKSAEVSAKPGVTVS